MDKTALAEWRAFLRAPSVRKARDCYFLFMDPLTPDDIEQIFQGVPQGDALAPRLARIKGVGATPPPIEGPERRARLQALATDFIAEQRRLLATADCPKLVAILDGLTPRWVDLEGYSAARESEGAWVQGDVMSMVSDVLRGALGDDALISTALSEATYGATSSKDMVWYLLAPMLTIEYAIEPVMLMRENAVHYALTDRELILLDRRADLSDPAAGS